MSFLARSVLFAAAFPGVFLVHGCAVGPDYEKPELYTPDAWHQQVAAELQDGDANLHAWWETLNDPLLDSLIGRARDGNLDLKTAFARVQEARALRGVSKGAWFPQVNGAASYERAQESEDFVPPQADNPNDFMFTGVDASWELDVFGRIRRSVESADANFQASIEDYRDVLVVLYADVADNYVEARALQARIRYAKSNVDRQRGSLSLTRDRRRAEIAPELDVRQAELNLARTESVIPLLESALVQAINRLGVLLGEPPDTLHEELAAEAPIPELDQPNAIGLPGDLLRRRPDIRRAERDLAFATARIGVATADLYPRFSLSGAFAFSANSDLFDSTHKMWSWGPAMSWNLFNGGRVRGRILANEARTEQAFRTYEQSVLLGLEEVENAIIAYMKEIERRDALDRSVVAASESVKLVQTLYKTGLTDFQNVLDMERSLFDQQDDLAQSEGNVTQQLIRLYRALGGGWEPNPEELEAEIVDAEEHGEPIM